MKKNKFIIYIIFLSLFTIFNSCTKEDITIKQQNNEIFININNYNSHYSLNIHNITGQLIDSKIINTQNFNYNLSGLETGIYFLSISNNNQLIKNFKIIKQ